MGEIRISFTCIDDAIAKIDQQLADFQSIKSDISSLPFNAAMNPCAISSTGLCADAVTIITGEKIEALVTAIETLFMQTKEFLQKAKKEYINKDSTISQKILN